MCQTLCKLLQQLSLFPNQVSLLRFWQIFAGIPFNPPQCPTGLLGSIGIISVPVFFFNLLFRGKRVIWNLEWIWNLPFTQDLAELEFQLEFNGCGWGRATWRSSFIKYLYLVIIWFAELSQWSQKLRQLFLHCCWYNGEVILWAKSWETEVLWAYFQGPKPYHGSHHHLNLEIIWAQQVEGGTRVYPCLLVVFHLSTSQFTSLLKWELIFVNNHRSHAIMCHSGELDWHGFCAHKALF